MRKQLHAGRPSRRRKHLAIAIGLLFCPTVAFAALEPKCVENSPERRGEIGCSYIADKRLPPGLNGLLVWHIDEFPSARAAEAAAGEAGVAFEAAHRWWLMSIEPAVAVHHGGKHVATVQLPPLPKAEAYRLLVISAYLTPDQTSRVHHHSGVEAFYSLEGEHCLETLTHAYHLRQGDTLAVPAGVTMQLVGAGSAPRRDFAILIYDASQPPTTRTPELEAQLVKCD